MITVVPDIQRVGSFSIFRAVFCGKQPSLSDVVKAVDWGSNRDIREKGFRVAPSVFEFVPEALSCIASACAQASMHFANKRKSITLVKDPSVRLEHHNIIFTPNGDSAVVVVIV